jgi:hypothetical protein
MRKVIGAMLWLFGVLAVIASGVFLVYLGMAGLESFLQAPIGIKPGHAGVDFAALGGLAIFAIGLLTAFLGSLVYSPRQSEHERIAKRRREIMGGGK